MKNTFEYLTNYNYYGRNPSKSKLIKEDELDDMLGLSGEGGDIPENNGGQQDIASQQPDTQAQPTQPVEDVQQLDVTDLIKKQEETNTTVGTILQKLDTVVKEFSGMKDDIKNNIELMKIKSQHDIGEIMKEIEKRVPTADEKMQLQTLSSYPYNVKLTDFWVPNQNADTRFTKVPNQKDETTYDVKAFKQGEGDEAEKEYVLTNKDVQNYDIQKIKKSFDFYV